MTVYLVGAGPGDPGLITVRGAEVLATADVVVHDRLAPVELLDLVPARAERVDVGKSPRHPTMTQDEINDLLVDRGRAGLEVVRLKGGDPYVFARGAEEAGALAAAGVAYEVIPGVSAAFAVPASAGIPVTMRNLSTSVTVVTGHEDPSKPEPQVDWEALGRVGGTIVILMGVTHLRTITDRLIAGGLAPDTPAAAVTWGTRPDQRTIRATLATLADERPDAPATVVVGAVAAQSLDWFEQRPLFGRTVVVTRSRSQASELAQELRRVGAAVVEAPVISITDPLDDGAALDAALADVGRYDWLVLTSPNGAQRVWDRLSDARQLVGVAVAAIGPGTARVLADRGIVADLVPERFVAESLLEAFPAPPAGGGRILLARAAEARDVLPDGLRAAGWDVDVVPAYRTVAAEHDPAVLDAVRSADVVTFTSSSTVDRFVAAFGIESVPPVVACIGPITAATAVGHGVSVDVEAERHTIEGLVDALCDWAAKR
ncbi:MAG: uroporphyrinogen-III C-methyltransferase [Actinobacteria bacterium]|nr:uroporphyrinogen-III C-methyltransferase [Actinomycetota bacterium]